MQGKERREALLRLLGESSTPISAARLAEMFGVTRQVIVADIALIRASGELIRAEHTGYVLEKKTTSRFKRITTKHTKDEIINEYYAIVDNGGRVLKVMVAHDIYGNTNCSGIVPLNID